MENTNLKRLAAMCAAAASLSTLGLAGTAMAVETPTTADTATASITLNAAQGNTLAGHTFDFYRLGSYGDITANGDTDVKSLTVSKIDDASDKWIAAANTKAGITDLQGFDAAGDLAHVGKDGEPTGTVQGQLREAAKQLAASASTSKIQAVKSVAGTGTTMTVSDLPNGLYLIVDSDGVPMIVGTPIQGTKTLNGVTLGTLTVKSKTTKIDKTVSKDRNNKGTFIDSKAGGTEDSASFTVGETVDFQIRAHPAEHAGRHPDRRQGHHERPDTRRRPRVLHRRQDRDPDRRQGTTAATSQTWATCPPGTRRT